MTSRPQPAAPDTGDSLTDGSVPGGDDELPRVPLPDLDYTCAQFAAWAAPLLSEDQLRETETAVADFLVGPGPVLQQALEEYDASGVDSWLDEFWRDRYLGRRDAIAVNANFFFHLHDDPRVTGQLERGAALLAASAAWKLRLDAGELPPGVDPKRQSTRQLRHLFGTTRIPGDPRDSVRTPWSEAAPGPSTATHALVMHRGQIWSLEVIDESGTAYSADAVRESLAAIVQDGREGPGVGVLTAQPRADWAASRARLLAANPANADALETIETALCALAIEDQQPESEAALDAVLLGGPGRDRWFDKSLTFVVFPDGTAGLNAEHCLLDGTTILQLVDEVWRDAPAGAPGQSAYRPVEVVVDADVRADLETAARGFAELNAQTVSTFVPLEGLSRDRVKALGSPPDAFFQLALQLAHRRARGQVGATYESVATTGFRAGRTEALRVVTDESVRFTEVMDDPEATALDRRDAYARAAAAHTGRARAASAGDAPEQHLWELQRIAARQPALDISADQPLFRSPGWVILRDDWLSTSAVPSSHVRSWGFGATSPRCIGVAYAMLPAEAYAFLSARPVVEADLHRLAEELRRAVGELLELLED
ncbi:choline/carnitine O-acyltransferase [Epidermidibacterium keratini]|uniref:Choline/carnitine O-acyltransferase n=1 Tax=Epidermidibacterium keratini TaxID=1891644 RepID=A0A7L4YS75_9ACTN|nr:choline/carnitine O-acyltransferase [Epidermidibacterium keratini]QHC01908.1 choline/carnitine O-acyltransferase [Epidermidibacterium keratini]